MNQQLGMPKTEFLEMVRRSLDRQPGPPHPAYSRLEEDLPTLREKVQGIQARLAEIRPALLDRFAEVAQLRGWQVYRSPDPEEAMAHIQSLATSRGINAVARSDQEALDQVPLDAPLQTAGISVTTIAQDETHSRESLRQSIAAAGMGITGADYAIAETGSIIVLPRKGLSRLVSVVPPIHVALVRPEDLIEDLDDLFLLRRLVYHENGGEMGSYLNFITGPSRTADIEQTLVVGVHGPKEAHLVLLG
jgi:L-lactate dehydrogenase complex protein LldG